MLLVGWASRRRLLPALGRGAGGRPPAAPAAGAAGVWGRWSPSALRAPFLPPGVVGRPFGLPALYCAPAAAGLLSSRFSRLPLLCGAGRQKW